MKIVCESCGAKYSIADEKVAGKVFKIRCKKCSAVIVVKGESPDGGDESTRVYDQGGDATWHVVVAGEQQGPFTPQQIGELLADGRIDWEAYVWREGMDGWQPAREVDPLRAALSAETAAGAAAAGGGGGVAYGTGQVFGGSSDMGADPFASDDGGLGSVISQPAARSGDDLFAKSARSPFSGASGDDEERVSGSQASARSNTAEALTGQRNENSVLFSLSNLQALATGSGSAPVTSSARPGMAVGEGSGLIDIRALASATQSVSEKPNGSSRDKVEDLLSVGSGAAGFSATHFAAPVAAEKADNSKLLLVGMFAAVLVLGGALAFMMLRQPVAQPGLVAATPTAPAPAEAPAAAAAAGQAAAVPTPEAPKQASAPSAAAGDDDNEHEREGSKSAGHSGGGKKPGRESSKASERESEPAPAPAPAAAPTPKKSGGDQSIDDLLSGALGAKAAPSKPAASKPAAADLPSTPSRDDVLGALKAVAPKVSACGNGQTGIAAAKIGVSGATGKVTSVDVGGQFAGTPVAACVAREAGKARFPKFANPSFSVTFPFKI
jgi:predicted Zn finger-like uncharacterized protein